MGQAPWYSLTPLRCCVLSTICDEPASVACGHDQEPELAAPVDLTPKLVSLDSRIHPKRLELPVRITVQGSQSPRHISKTALSTVHLNPPNWTNSRTSLLRFQLVVYGEVRGPIRFLA